MITVMTIIIQYVFSLTLSILQLVIFDRDKDWQDSQAMITVMTIIIQYFFLLVSLFYS